MDGQEVSHVLRGLALGKAWTGVWLLVRRPCGRASAGSRCPARAWLEDVRGIMRGRVDFRADLRQREQVSRAVRNMRGTLCQCVGWHAHEHRMVCPCALEVSRSRMHAFSPYTSRG